MSRRFRPRAALSLVAASFALAALPGGFLPGGASGAEAAPATAQLAPHRAIYSMKLGGKRAGSATVGARGTMYIEWAESCDGWTVTQRVGLVLSTTQGDDIETDSNFSSWESKDGLSYRFTVRNMRDGKLSEELRGAARLQGSGGGEAVFTTPAGLTFSLPPKAIFPTEHVAHLIEGARAGSVRVSRVIFDGASLDGPLEVNAVIGKPVPPAGEGLTAGRSWPMRLAFFPVQSQSAAPEYEVGLRLYENGVADRFVLDYGEFVVDAEIEKIEPLAKPRC